MEMRPDAVSTERERKLPLWREDELSAANVPAVAARTTPQNLGGEGSHMAVAVTDRHFVRPDRERHVVQQPNAGRGQFPGECLVRPEIFSIVGQAYRSKERIACGAAAVHLVVGPGLAHQFLNLLAKRILRRMKSGVLGGSCCGHARGS